MVKFGGRHPTGTPSLTWSSAVVVVSLFVGAFIVHNIFKPDLFGSQRLVPLVVSCITVLCSQLLLYLIAHFCASLSVLFIVVISAFTLLVGVALGSKCRRLLGISASAPAFVVFTTLFLWGVYLTVIREGTSLLNNVVLNLQFLFLLVGLDRIFKSDPGVVAAGYSCLEKSVGNVSLEDTSMGRVRYCKTCKRHIKGFDHHCPAFGNCIGQNNHVLFVVLLFSFVIAETSYVMCSRKFIQKSQSWPYLEVKRSVQLKLGISTMVFCLVQLLWQVMFLVWHICCICINCKTDEWVNWQKYQEFQEVIEPPQGYPPSEIKFINPYDKGALKNISEFLGFGEKHHAISAFPS